VAAMHIRDMGLEPSTTASIVAEPLERLDGLLVD
jgi:hypothetical protein